MKKLYSILGLCALFALPTFAQEEEDMTSYIKNPGFDEDVTWTTVGGMKEIVDKSESLSSRSTAWVAADGTCYCYTDNTSTNWKRTNDSWAINGFIGQINGWTLVSNKATTAPYKSASPEWVYFGSVPYGLGETAIPVADDGTTYLAAPATKPETDNGDDNKAAVYLRAGWGGSAVYKQVVNLPCAQYRLEYWIYNANFAGSQNNTKVKNLCKVTCRDDEFVDEDGFNAQDWTLHTIEFTPTSEFTIEFGFQSDGGSNSNPFLFIDGIKLYKVGEADRESLLQSDIMHYVDLLISYADENLSDNSGIVDEVNGKAEEFSDATAEGDLEAMEVVFKEAKAYYEALTTTVTENVQTLNAQVEKAAGLLESETQYPGADDLNAALEAAQETLSNGTIADIEAGIAAIEKAIDDYYMSQEATPENPADFTFYVDNPTFAAQGKWYIGEGGGDQTIKTDKTDNDGNPINCWNAWRNNLEYGNTLSINQDLTGLRNGKYTLTADINTQDGCITNQHLFANGIADSAESPVMTITGWNPCVWQTLTTGVVIVTDGNLTIGAIGVSDGDIPSNHGGTDTDKRRGWFNLTNVKLNYLGEATAEEVAAVIASKFAAAEELADTMHFAADKATFKAAIESAKAENDLESLNAAKATAEASETEYQGIIAGTYKALNDSIANNPNYTATAIKVVKVPVDYMTNYLGSAEATYTEGAKITPVLRKYRDSVIPTILAAEKMTVADPIAKEALANTLADVVAALAVYEPETTVLDGYVNKLNEAMSIATLSDYAYGDGKDATVYLKNPEITGVSSLSAAVNGWTSTLADSGNNYFTNKGQGYTGDGNDYYLDSWNGTAGLLKVKNSQIVDVPNGTYEVSALMRTTGEGFYLFATADDVTEKAEATVNTADYTGWMKPALNEETGEYSYAYNADQYGEVWFKAAEAVKAAMGLANADENASLYDLAIDKNNGETTCPENVDPTDWAIFAANNGIGRGWMKRTVTIEVKNHTLEIGVATADAFDETAAFTGTWLSADHFVLTMVKAGDNTGWSPATGVQTIESANATASSIFSITGARVNTLQKGINIVKMSNGEVKKVLVK